MMNLQPQYLTLANLLRGRLFRIPEYQRAYSWKARQRDDFFGDILRVHQKGHDEGHFMAAIVCLRRDKQRLGTDDYHVLEVVDGQQRLTTIIILLRAIQHRLSQDSAPEAKVKLELADLLVKADSGELLLLQTNHDTYHRFADYLRKGVAAPSADAETIADRDLLEAVEHCQRFTEEWCSQGRPITDLLALLKNRLHFLLHEIDDEKSVYTVFEVLNSRGLDVSWLDRLKSILMGRAFELPGIHVKGLMDELHASWKDIYSVVGLRQGMSTEALRFAATLSLDQVPSRPLGEQDAVEYLRSQAVDANAIRSVSTTLRAVARACDMVRKDVRINAVTSIGQARLLAVAIYLRDDFKEEERSALLSKWEKVTFRIYGMLAKDARFRVGDYVRLAWQVVRNRDPYPKIDNALSKIGEEFGIDQAIDDLRGDNCYEGWTDELRYLLYRYEEHLTSEEGIGVPNAHWSKIWRADASDSIEHIWPRSKAPIKYVHRLGNLLLLPPLLNSKLQALPAKRKVDDYRKTGLLIATKVADAIEENGWNAAEIRKREEEILEWARREWAD